MKSLITSYAYNVGVYVYGILRYVGGLSILIMNSFRGVWAQKKRGFAPVVISQTLFTGVQALPLVAATALFIGIIIISQSVTTMPKLGAGDFFGKIFVIVVIRELGPLLTSITVIGRSGSALATYIGYMKVNQEIDALEVMGIDPVHFLVMPAMLGSLIAMICLTLFFDMISVMGGYFFIYLGKVFNITAFSFDLPLRMFLYKITSALELKDIFISLIKCVFFAIIISSVACYNGLNLAPSFNEVPKATRKTVVQTLVITMLFNSIISVMYYVS